MVGSPPRRARKLTAAKTAGGLSIAYVPLANLIPYKNNSRTHTGEQIEQIKASMLRFGWTVPIAIADHGVLAGHARLMAALSLAEEGKAIPRNPDPLRGPVVDLSALTAAERRAYVIADNKIAEAAGWDMGLLRFEMGDLRLGGFDLALTGFSDLEIAGIFTDPKPPASFPGYDETIEVEHTCPRCGFAWSGKATDRPLAAE